MHRTATAALAVTALAAPATLAQSLTGVGDLPGGIVNSVADGVSGDGNVVVGNSSAGSGTRAFRWRKGASIAFLPIPPDFAAFGSAVDANFDGSVIVGSNTLTTGREAARWQNNILQGLGAFPDATPFTIAEAVSADGNTVVGFGRVDTGNSIAFRWTAATQQLEPLGALPVDADFRRLSVAQGVNEDGSVIAGYSNTDLIDGTDAQVGFIRTDATGLLPIGVFPAGEPVTQINDLSADGLTAVGTVNDNPDRAFSWSNARGLIELPDVPGGAQQAEALAVNRNGSVIVGIGNDAGGIVATVWINGGPAQSLETILTNQSVNLNGWQLWEARGVSDDGVTIVGRGINPSGNPEGFVAEINPGVPAPVNDVDLSVPFGTIDAADIRTLIDLVHDQNPAADLNNDGVVDFLDIARGLELAAAP